MFLACQYLQCLQFFTHKCIPMWNVFSLIKMCSRFWVLKNLFRPLEREWGLVLSNCENCNLQQQIVTKQMLSLLLFWVFLKWLYSDQLFLGNHWAFLMKPYSCENSTLFPNGIKSTERTFGSVVLFVWSCVFYIYNTEKYVIKYLLFLK